MNIHNTIRNYILDQYLKGQEPEYFDDDYNLIDDGIIDSLAIFNTVTYLEKQYDITFGEGDIIPEHFMSINALSAFVLKKQNELTSQNKV